MTIARLHCHRERIRSVSPVVLSIVKAPLCGPFEKDLYIIEKGSIPAGQEILLARLKHGGESALETVGFAQVHCIPSDSALETVWRLIDVGIADPLQLHLIGS